MRRFFVGSLLALVIGTSAIDGRVPQPNEPTGQEFSAAAQGGGGAVDVEGTLLIPRRAGQMRAIITVLRWGVGMWVYDDPSWRQLADDLHCGVLRLVVNNHNGPDNPLELPVGQQAVRNAALGGAEGVLNVLGELARRSGRREIADAKLLFWGHSAAGSFGTTFAELYPTRTIAFVRYHSHSRGLPVDLAKVGRTPALIVAGEKDTTAGVEDSETLWRSGRLLEAPWTYAVEPAATHGSPEALKKANELAIPWVRAVIEQRLSKGGGELLPVAPRSGWLTSISGGESAPLESFRGPKEDAAWLPDAASLQGWRVVTGASGQ